MKPFDFINSINFTKKNMMRGTENDDLAEKSYVPYITNRTLSYFTDTLLYANEMNRFASTLDSKLQYEFLLNNERFTTRYMLLFYEIILNEYRVFTTTNIRINPHAYPRMLASMV